MWHGNPIVTREELDLAADAINAACMAVHMPMPFDIYGKKRPRLAGVRIVTQGNWSWLEARCGRTWYPLTPEHVDGIIYRINQEAFWGQYR